MIYLGVALILLGMYIILADALSFTPSIVTAFGGFVFSIGLIMSYVGFKGRDREDEKMSETILSELAERHPLGYLDTLTNRSVQNLRKSGGNRAMGFVLISVGAFLIGIIIVLPLTFIVCCHFDFNGFLYLLVNPLSLFGIICFAFGMCFRKISYH